MNHQPPTLHPPSRFEAEAIRAWLNAWLTSGALGVLAEECGWKLPRTLLTQELLDRWAELSVAWDFRGGAERHRMSWEDAKVNGRTLADDLVVACASELGLVEGMAVPHSFTQLVILGGMVRAYASRTSFARSLFEDASRGPDTALLSGHRPLTEAEGEEAVRLGWGIATSEMDIALPALVSAFGVPDPGGPEDCTEYIDSTVPSGLDVEEWRLRQTCRVWSWSAPAPGGRDACRFRVVVSPSGDPAGRRTNTADQLAHWARLTEIGRNDSVVLVTTAHYGVFQQLAGLRLLARDHGCEVVTTGSPWRPDGPKRGAGYLQEIRSTFLEARRLLAVLPPV